MAKSSITPHDYIQTAFAPQISILCSEDADHVCLKNNLRFVELLQPFSKPTSDARITDPMGNSIIIKNFKVFFEDMNKRPPQPTLGKKILHQAVANAGASDEAIKIETLELQQSTPWFETWRDIFLQIQYPSDHEFTKHYIACIIVISASSENAMDQLNRLSQYQHQQQHQNPGRFPKWFSPNILKYYVLLDDMEQTDASRADHLFEQMVSAYGSLNCHLLRINSCSQRQSDKSDPWKQYLNHRGLLDGNESLNCNSDVSSGSLTPREEVVSLPSRVTEGDSSEASDMMPPHPLSPLAAQIDPNGIIDSPPPDVPLLVNSKSFVSEDIEKNHYGEFLTSSDIDRIKVFVDDFCIKSLIPHAERQIKYLNDVVTNRSRSKSILSATRRWLGGSKAPSGGSNSVIYSQEATELQTRRLGDLCFMFGLYEMAYNAYYMAKNDFKSDQAWLYFAGAQEMAALSLFMQNSVDFPKRYLEGSLHSYLNVCKVYNFAIRLTLLSTEVFKHYEEFGEAAMMFIKITSEESDLLSALMLEQAAYCFINSKRPLLRKFAFHMTLAGHRFGKAGQHSHSLRVYKQAFQVYCSRGWILAEDHILYSMGKQAFHLKQIPDSLENTTRLITQSTNDRASSHQLANQQAAYVREFINVMDKYLRTEGKANEIPLLPVPLLDCQNTKVILGTPLVEQDKDWKPVSNVDFSDEESLHKRWFILENELLQMIKSQNMIFKPTLHLVTNETPNSSPQCVPVGELVRIKVVLKNPLLVSLTVCSIRPLFKFFNEAGKEMADETSVTAETVSGFNMPPQSEESVTFEVWPQQIGRFLITGVAFTLSLTSEVISKAVDISTKVSIAGRQDFRLKGPRLNNTLAERTSVVYAKDERLNIIVTPAMPRLCVLLKDPPGVLGTGELKKVDLCLRNDGPVPLQNLYVATSTPKNILFASEEDVSLSKNKSFMSIKKCRDNFIQNRIDKIELPNGGLNPGDSLASHLWLHAPFTSGVFNVELLFYYESSENFTKLKFRLVRHRSSIYLYPNIRLAVQCYESSNLLTSLNPLNHCLHSANLVVNVKNIHEVESSGASLQIIGVSSSSKFWRVIPHSEREDNPPITVNQSCQLCIRCVPMLNPEGDLLSFINLSPTEDIPSCWWRFILRERWRVYDLPDDSSNPTPGSDVVHSTHGEPDSFKNKEALNLDMVVTVIWKVCHGESVLIGQHSLYLDSLGQRESVPVSKNWLTAEESRPPIRFIMDDETSKETNVAPLDLPKNLVKVSLKHTREVFHNFNHDPLCRIAVTYSFYNTSAYELMALINFFSKPPQRVANQMQIFSPRACTDLLTVGSSVRKIRLKSKQLVNLDSTYVVSRPGTYSLGAVNLKVRHLDSEEWLAQVCDSQSSVVVKSEGS